MILALIRITFRSKTNPMVIREPPQWLQACLPREFKFNNFLLKEIRKVYPSPKQLKAQVLTKLSAPREALILVKVAMIQLKAFKVINLTTIIRIIRWRQIFK